jgi:single-stranded-DNA-specific exonuclease
LSACADHIETFGGHSLAAGLEIKVKKIDRFKVDFENVVSNMARSFDFTPKITIDYKLDFFDISNKLVDELESLKPFGTGNPEPLFMAQNVRIVSSKRVGQNHRQMVLDQPWERSGNPIPAIQFNVDTRIPLTDNFDQIAYRLRWNRWNGRKRAQIIIEET